MSSPLINTFKFLESVFISLFPVALVTSITLTGALLYLGAFTFATLFILKQKKDFNFSNLTQIDIAFLTYILAFSLSKLFNTGIGAAFHTFFRSCEDYFVFLWVLFFALKSDKEKKLIKYSILIAAFISIFYGLMQAFHLDIFHRQENIERLSGFHKNSYSYAGQLIVFYFLLLNNFFSSKKKEIFSSLLFLAACFFCILNTSERAVIFGIVLGTLIYFLLKKVKKGDLLNISPAIIIPIFLTLMFNIKVFKRIMNVISPQRGSKPNVRLRVWEIALSTWKKNVIFGVGKFPVVYHQAGALFPVQALTHAHNIYLQTLVANGIVGLLAFLNLFFSIFKAAFLNLKNNRYAICLITALSAFFIEGFFESFWSDSEVRYLLLYFVGFVISTL